MGIRIKEASWCASTETRPVTWPISVSHADTCMEETPVNLGLSQNNNEEVTCAAQSTTAGMLYASLNFWENTLKANDYILSAIRFGYSIPFVKLPSPCFLKNNASSLKYERFVRSKIQALLCKGYVEELTEKPFCVNPLTVATAKKLRLCWTVDIQTNSFDICHLKWKAGIC